MKSKDQTLLEEAYHQVNQNNNSSFRWIDAGPGAEISNRTYHVRGKDVLFKREKDQDEDSVWYYYSFVDPETNDRVFKEMSEEEILAAVKNA